MLPHPEDPTRDAQTGFTLVELVIVIVVLGIVSAYAIMGVSLAEMSLPSQAQKLASDIRHAQTLAYTSGRHMCFAIVTAGANGTYGACGATCVTAPTPCDADFRVTLEKGVILAGPATLDFTTLGRPSGAANYTLASGSTVKVSVAALTGLVHVCPPDPAGTCP